MMLIIKIFLALLLVGGAGAVIYSSFSPRPHPTTAPVAHTTPTTQQRTTQPGDTPRTIIGLLQRGGNYSCAFNPDLSRGKITGGVYINGERLSGFVTTFTSDPSKTTNLVFIRNPDLTYIWDNPIWNTQKVGIKTPSIPIASGGLPVGSHTEFTEEFAFTCAPWKVIEGVFTPPATVMFTPA